METKTLHSDKKLNIEEIKNIFITNLEPLTNSPNIIAMSLVSNQGKYPFFFPQTLLSEEKKSDFAFFMAGMMNVIPKLILKLNQLENTVFQTKIRRVTAEMNSFYFIIQQLVPDFNVVLAGSKKVALGFHIQLLNETIQKIHTDLKFLLNKKKKI
ncbi:MAG: hypothetical protein ACFFC7_12135 [Candidatus Hermodarchaeota archaeon]